MEALVSIQENISAELEVIREKMEDLQFREISLQGELDAIEKVIEGTEVRYS
jgi:hypothetical protein